MYVRLDRKPVVLVSSQTQTASEKVKLCKLMTKKKERLGRREEKGRLRRFHCILNYLITTLLYCVRGTRTQPLICVGFSVHYWVSCAINKGGFFEIAFVIVLDTHLPRAEAFAYVLPHFDALTQSTNPFRLCILNESTISQRVTNTMHCCSKIEMVQQRATGCVWQPMKCSN